MLSPLAVFLLNGAAATPGFAAAEDEWQLGGTLGADSLRADDRRIYGGIAGIDLQRGVTDAWAVRGALDLALHPVERSGARPGGLVWAGGLSLGVTYTVDVLRVLPFVEAGFGLLVLGGDVVDARRDAGLEVGFGADYLLSPRWAVGAVVRYRHLLVRLGGGRPTLDGDPSLVGIGVRVSRIFESL
jgi:opacity protein-like surface antigen